MIIKEVPTCISDTIYSLRSEYDAMQNDAARWRSSRVVDGNDLIPGWLGLFARWCSTHGFNIDKNFPADPTFGYWTDIGQLMNVKNVTLAAHHVSRTKSTNQASKSRFIIYLFVDYLFTVVLLPSNEGTFIRSFVRSFE